MNSKHPSSKRPAEQVVKDIRRATRRHFSAEDKIRIVLEGYDPLTMAITDFVEITTSGSNSIIKVDVDGGANNFLQIGLIAGVTGLTDEQALLTSGNIIA
ncbi:MAG: hypothetical protein V4441_12930 [Pseudomonadota bacterium]